jgi:phosphatidylglycerophosphate synthase
LNAAAILLLSGLTDMLDGIIARKCHQITELGQMLDPLSDKLTQGAVAICLAVKQPILIPFLAIFVIKETLMVCAGIFLISRKKKRPGRFQMVWKNRHCPFLYLIWHNCASERNLGDRKSIRVCNAVVYHCGFHGLCFYTVCKNLFRYYSIRRSEI